MPRNPPVSHLIPLHPEQYPPSPSLSLTTLPVHQTPHPPLLQPIPTNVTENHLLVIRVPIGSPVLLISTHALSSKRTTCPSLRCSFFAVRTTIACRISPRRTLFMACAAPPPPPGLALSPKLRCFCTTTMMRSPAVVGGLAWVGREEQIYCVIDGAAYVCVYINEKAATLGDALRPESL